MLFQQIFSRIIAHFTRQLLNNKRRKATDQNILQDIKFQNSDIKYLQNALQSVYPQQISLSNSTFVLLTPKYIRAENKILGILLMEIKSNANFDIQDQQIIKSLAYEMQFRIVHRETQKMLNKDNYCLLQQDWQQCIQNLELYQFNEEVPEDFSEYVYKNNWTIVKNKQLSTDEQEEQITRDFIKDHTLYGEDNTVSYAYAIELTQSENLDLLGIYDICLSFRNVSILQSFIQVIPSFNFTSDSINKINKPKLTQQQILQKFKIKENNQILYQSGGYHTIEMNQLQDLKEFQIYKVNSPQQSPKNQQDIKQYDEEFSVTSDDQVLPSSQVSQKREIQVETDINEFIKKLFGGGQHDDLTTFEIQSSKGSKTIIDSTDDQIQVNGKQAITNYNEQNIIQNQIRIFTLQIISGSCIIYFNRDSLMMSNMTYPDNGIHVFTDCISFSSNVQYYKIKFVQSKDNIDVYCNNQFLGNYKYQNLFIKFCSKGTEIKLD